MVKVDISGAAGFFSPGGPDYGAAADAHRLLESRTMEFMDLLNEPAEAEK